ncbi:hypothetical protein OGM63_22635 [Plectonema radiosum NIES-515]|uniref:Uncharacterized protein n=1 Tax=Plectonema radiosum NIES-515 TaxID=2986073 RepID=A0ABT3B4H8_9CYAN|nr:hypothetical protein [Plectonema radiosum]MCV3216276.1 hypothetical protein [Plectonema radiosum NIES-515]
MLKRYQISSTTPHGIIRVRSGYTLAEVTVIIVGSCDRQHIITNPTFRVPSFANFVTQTKRTGRTDEYRVTPASDWVPKKELDEIRKAIAGKSPKTSIDEETEID